MMAGMLGARIKRLRLERDLTQEQLAVRAKLTSATIRRLEREQVVDIRLPTLEAVAEALEIPLPELLTDDEPDQAVADTA